MTDLLTGPYLQADRESELTAAQQTMFDALGVDMAHMDSGGEIAWPTTMDDFTCPVSSIQAWVNQRIPDTAYAGWICLDWESFAIFSVLTTPGHVQQAAVEAQYVIAVQTVTAMRPNAKVGIFGIPYVGTTLATIIPAAESIPLLITASTGLTPVFYPPLDGELPDVEYIAAAMDIILDNSPDIVQGKPVCYLSWARNRETATVDPVVLRSEQRWEDELDAAVGDGSRAYDLSAAWSWNADDVWHASFLLQINPYYTVLLNEEPWYGGSGPFDDWAHYSNIRGERQLTIWHNVLEGTSLPLPSFPPGTPAVAQGISIAHPIESQNIYLRFG